MTHLVLVGMRGSGKSSAGRAAARLLGLPFVDVDGEIAAAAGAPIARLFRERGEAAFRRLEARALARLRRRPSAVIATGGGAVTTPAGRRLIRGLGVVVWLQVGAAELERRLRLSPGRPALLGREPHREVRALLRRRGPLYRALAQASVRAGSGSIGQVAARIARRFRLLAR